MNVGILKEIKVEESRVSIPEQSGHPFHAKADSDSIPFRTPIPFESGQ